MLNIENGISESEPVFVPPRKRQSSKKPNGVQNYVDHIVCAQVSQINSTSPESNTRPIHAPFE